MGGSVGSRTPFPNGFFPTCLTPSSCIDTIAYYYSTGCLIFDGKPLYFATNLNSRDMAQWNVFGSILWWSISSALKARREGRRFGWGLLVVGEEWRCRREKQFAQKRFCSIFRVEVWTTTYQKFLDLALLSLWKTLFRGLDGAANRFWTDFE